MELLGGGLLLKGVTLGPPSHNESYNKPIPGAVPSLPLGPDPLKSQAKENPSFLKLLLPQH